MHVMAGVYLKCKYIVYGLSVYLMIFDLVSHLLNVSHEVLHIMNRYDIMRTKEVAMFKVMFKLTPILHNLFVIKCIINCWAREMILNHV